ncbi:phosphoribosyl-ATP pyrophosphohydrolase [Oceanobacillus luteolus]|uniref:Phosphoribosyl-ATP pyrophosphohydrolase n=1 Tax=Oceanobacillus luteolus TaxID=1274358 RepID=A0ABW4HKN9_9BACI
MTTYNKLVRDRIPEILDEAGKKYNVETLNHDRYILELRKKLMEELSEYQEAANDEESLGELADILEVIYALTEVHGESFEKLEQLRKQKAEENGAFADKVYLMDVEE